MAYIPVPRYPRRALAYPGTKRDMRATGAMSGSLTAIRAVLLHAPAPNHRRHRVKRISMTNRRPSRTAHRPLEALTRWASLGLLGLTVACGPGFDPEAETLSTDVSSIIGGQTVVIEDHPHMVSLWNRTGQFCGGAIINAEWVATAHHCVADERPDSFAIVAGVTRLSEARSGQIRNVAQIERAPGFSFSQPNLGQDFALVRVTPPFDLSSPKVKTIDILRETDAAQGALDAGTPVTVSGWGTTDAPSRDHLQAVTLNIVDLREAERILRVPLDNSQIAAFGTGKDSCQGDSGGPLTVTVGGKTKLAGVVSWGPGCATRSPGFYARLPSFEAFIQTHIPNLGTTQPAAPPTPSTATAHTPAGSALIISEIFSAPPSTFDANGDGNFASDEDEFIELHNASAQPFDLGGIEIETSGGLSGQFPAGVRLQPGERLVIFSGGRPQPIPGAQVFVGRLRLEDTGGSVTLRDANGQLVDEVRFGAAGSCAWTRPSPADAFSLHHLLDGQVASPGA